MTMQAITPLSAGFVDASGNLTGKNSGDGSASFADLLSSVAADAGSPPSPQEIEAATKAHMVQRISQVGFVQYLQEQQQEKKMLRVFRILAAESPPDEQAVLNRIQNDFERNPPDGLQDMYARIDQAVAAIPPPEPPNYDNLRDRMKVVDQEIHQMMNDSDNALALREHADGLSTFSG
ncbi:MAG: hypothetical protein JO128_13140 [Alphaproteobacteria bacterium]|nr:hypothetical protein [Alphaproteobacteria bacterium]